MKAISLWEPWGSAIARGLKCNETRGWETKYRGPLVIHCARTTAHLRFIFDPSVCEAFQRVGIYSLDDLSPGRLVAVCDLVEVKTSAQVVAEGGLSKVERALGNYDPGRFIWILDNIRRLPNPIEYRGRQGFFEVPDSILKLAT